MKKLSLFNLIICFLLVSAAHTEETKELVIRSAQVDLKAMVAVEAYLSGDLLETKVSVGMEKARPSILNVIVEGPGIGRLVPVSVKEVYASLEELEEKPYKTTKIGGFIDSGDKPKEKKLEGSITRKFYIFKIPKEKISSDGKYEIKVKVGTVKQVAGSGAQYTSFSFSLDNFPQLVLQQNEIGRRETKE
jgi:hypothetical protein